MQRKRKGRKALAFSAYPAGAPWSRRSGETLLHRLGYFTVPCRAALMMASVSMPSRYTPRTMRLASGAR